LKKFLAGGPTANEVKLAKQNISGSFVLKLASNSDILSNILMIGFYGLPSNYLDKYRSNVEKVTMKDITRAFSKYIRPNELITVTVGAGKEMKKTVWL